MKALITLLPLFALACGGSSTGTRDALLAYARSGEYLGWAKEPALHVALGPHGAFDRVYVNPALYASLKASNTVHPSGSVTVKEIFDASMKRTGYAVMEKGPDGVWSYFEGLEPAYDEFFFRGTGNLCASCHAGGRDMILTQASSFP